MKTISKLLWIFAISTLTSCVGSIIDPTPANGGKLTATIDGKSFKAKDVSAVSLFGSLVVTADNGDESIGITLILTEIKQGQTFDLSTSSGSSLVGISYSNKDHSFTSKSGELKITKFNDNKVIEGNFDMIGTDFNGNEIAISKGEFEANIVL